MRIRERAGKDGLVVILGVTKATVERNVLEPMRCVFEVSQHLVQLQQGQLTGIGFILPFLRQTGFFNGQVCHAQCLAERSDDDGK